MQLDQYKTFPFSAAQNVSVEPIARATEGPIAWIPVIFNTRVERWFSK